MTLAALTFISETSLAEYSVGLVLHQEGSKNAQIMALELRTIGTVEDVMFSRICFVRSQFKFTLYLNADRKGAAASLSGFETPMGNSPGSYQLSVLKFEPVFQTT